MHEESKIKEVYLFTNRILIAFDEKGEQVFSVQESIGWNTAAEIEKEENALERIISDGPTIYLASLKLGKKIILTMDEFCSLLGHGPWYQRKLKIARHNFLFRKGGDKQ